MDIREAIDELRAQLRDRPDLATLKGVRERIDDPAFAAAVWEFCRRRHNDPAVLLEFQSQLILLLRDLQDMKADVDYDMTQTVAIGIGGGVALVGGSIVAALSIALFPVVVLIPIVGGAMMGGAAFRGGRSLNRESTTLNHIIERLKPLSDDPTGGKEDDE